MKKTIILALFLLVGCGNSLDDKSELNIQKNNKAIKNFEFDINIGVPEGSNQNLLSETQNQETNLEQKKESILKTSDEDNIIKPKINTDNESVINKPEVSENNKVEEKPKVDLTKEIFKRFLNNMKNLKTSRTTLKNYVVGTVYKKKETDEERIGSSTVKVTFERPRKSLMHIVESSDSPSLNQTKVYFDGGEKVKVRVPGILGLFKFTFAYDRPDFSNYRGYLFPDVDMISLEERFNSEGIVLKLIGTSEVDNKEVYLIEVSNIKPVDDKITKEIVGISKGEYSLILHQLFEGEKLVYQNEFLSFEINPELTDEDFEV